MVFLGFSKKQFFYLRIKSRKILLKFFGDTYSKKRETGEEPVSFHLTSRRDRANRQEREDQHILPEMDEPGPEQSAGFEHRFAQQPAQEACHQHADDAVGDAVIVSDAKKGCHQEQGLAAAGRAFEHREEGGLEGHLLAESVQRGGQQDGRDEGNRPDDNIERRASGDNQEGQSPQADEEGESASEGVPAFAGLGSQPVDGLDRRSRIPFDQEKGAGFLFDCEQHGDHGQRHHQTQGLFGQHVNVERRVGQPVSVKGQLVDLGIDQPLCPDQHDQQAKKRAQGVDGLPEKSQPKTGQRNQAGDANLQFFWSFVMKQLLQDDIGQG